MLFSISISLHLTLLLIFGKNIESGKELNTKNHLIVIAGPTASGKTALSVKLAKALHCEVISADSRQFYKELSVGTAKPDEEEMQGVRHHLLDFLPLEEEFSAGKFELAVLELLHDIFAKNDRCIMTGGSGLYIQAVCEGMNNIPAVDKSFRDELYKELDVHGLQPLVEELKTKDPVYYGKVDKKNTQRVIRALEVCRATGMPYSSFRSDRKGQRPFNIIRIGLERDRQDLFGRIDRRMDRMIEKGLFEEAKKFYNKRHLNALKTVGYKEIFDYLDGKYGRQEAIRLLKRNSRRYAKRQMTWFKKDPEFAWFHPDDYEKILHYIHKKMAENS